MVNKVTREIIQPKVMKTPVVRPFNSFSLIKIYSIKEYFRAFTRTLFKHNYQETLFKTVYRPYDYSVIYFLV